MCALSRSVDGELDAPQSKTMFGELKARPSVSIRKIHVVLGGLGYDMMGANVDRSRFAFGSP